MESKYRISKKNIISVTNSNIYSNNNPSNSALNSVLNAITPDISSSDSLQQISNNNSSLGNIIQSGPSQNTLYTGPNSNSQQIQTTSIGQGFAANSFNFNTVDSTSLITSAQSSLNGNLTTQQSASGLQALVGTSNNRANRVPLNVLIGRLEALKSSTGIIDPVKLVSQLQTDDLLALLDYQASGELTDPRIESELYSVLLGINENYIDRNLLDISLKNDEAIKVLYNLRHEQLVYKLNLVKQQLTLKSILEQQLTTQQMTKIKLNQLLQNYEQKLVVLVNNYRKKLQELQNVSRTLSPTLASNQNISVSSLGINQTPLISGSKYLIDQSTISPLAYQALTNIKTPSNVLNLNLPNLQQSLNTNQITVVGEQTQNTPQVVPLSNNNSLANLLSNGTVYTIIH